MEKVVYGHITKISDVVRNNRKMRAAIIRTKTRKTLQKILRQSAVLLSYSKSKEWEKNFPGKLTMLRQEIRHQYSLTAKAANARAKQLGIKGGFDVVLG